MSQEAENFEREHTKRVYKLVGGVVAAIAVTIGGLFWLTSNDGPKEEIKSTLSITQAEQLNAELLSKDFLKSVGNFGVRGSDLTADNILNVSYILRANGASTKDYIIPRSESYLSAKDKFIAEGSPLEYDSREVLQWKNTLEDETLSSFNISDVTVNSNENGQYVTIDNESVKSVDVNIDFNTKQTIRTMTGSDSDWDGSWNVLEKTFINNPAKLTLVEIEGEWKVFSLNGLEKQFLLSTWKTPDSEAYIDTQQNFSEVDILKPKEASKETKK